MLWSKQYLSTTTSTLAAASTTPALPPPPKEGRVPQRDWRHMFNDDIISMPDKWEYPWYAAWDLAFHMRRLRDGRSRLRQVTARSDPARTITCTQTASCRPTSGTSATSIRPCTRGPPACLSTDRGAKRRQGRYRVSRTHASRSSCSTSPGGSTARTAPASNVFEGGFLGLDNIGVFDRSARCPPAAIWSRPTAPLDGLLQPAHAAHRRGAGAARSGLSRTSSSSSSSTSCGSRAHEPHGQ